MQAANNVGTSNAQTSRKNLIRAGLGALAGAVVGYGFMTLAVKIGVPARTLSWSDFLAIWVGIVFVAFGLILAGLSLNRKRLARALEGTVDAERDPEAIMPASANEVRQATMQSIVFVLAGVLLTLPILVQGPIQTNAALAGYCYAGIAVLFLVQTALNIELWRTADEFLQRTMLIICAGTFAVGQGLLFLYAAAERLHLLAPITSWDVVAHLLTLYLLVSLFVGVLQRRQW